MSWELDTVSYWWYEYCITECLWGISSYLDGKSHLCLWVTLTVWLGTKHSFWADTSLDILLEALGSSVSRGVLSDMCSEEPKPPERLLITTSREIVSKSPVGWTLPWGWLPVSRFGNWNRISKTCCWLSPYLLGRSVNKSLLSSFCFSCRMESTVGLV